LWDYPAEFVRAQEDERARVACDLHDGPAQSIASALLCARLLEEAPESRSVRDGLTELCSLLQDALEETYEIIGEFDSRCEDEGDVVARVSAAVDSFSRRSGGVCRFEHVGIRRPVPSAHAISIARIVQEALANVRRHSDALEVSVRLTLGASELSCEVRDDGRGFRIGEARSEAAVSGPGLRLAYGLRSMRQRARLLGGACEITSEPGFGTRVRATIPLPEGW
jgi:two-component system sensor histidine kinase DegS